MRDTGGGAIELGIFFEEEEEEKRNRRETENLDSQGGLTREG